MISAGAGRSAKPSQRLQPRMLIPAAARREHVPISQYCHSPRSITPSPHRDVRWRFLCQRPEPADTAKFTRGRDPSRCDLSRSCLLLYPVRRSRACPVPVQPVVLASWLLPVLDDASGHADGDAPGGTSRRTTEPPPVIASSPIVDRRDSMRVTAKEDILAYLRTIFLAVRPEVGGNDASGDVGARANGGVADVAKVVHLHVLAECRVLDLGEVADVRARQ